MKETNFEEWIVWAKSTNNLDIANVEPIITLFLEKAEEEGNSMFLGKVWNGSNWHNVSNSYRNMLEFVFLQNPPRYTYPALLGLSIKEMDYHGIETNLLEEAVEKVPSERWKLFCDRYLDSKQKIEALSSSDSNSAEKLKWVYKALVRLVRQHIPNEAPANAINEYLVLEGLLPVS